MNTFIDITEGQKQGYNKVVNHPLQSYEWGEFRKKTGIKVIRRGLVEKEKIIDGFTLTLHKIPGIPYSIGYLPKGNLPTEETLAQLHRIGKENNCVYIQLEPNVPLNTFQVAEWTPGRWNDLEKLGLRPSFHPLFTKYTFILDLTKSEDELLKAMHPKTRYNIKVAQKHGVEVVEDNSDEAFDIYLNLTEETTKRQKFHAHTKKYHELMWETFKNQKLENKLNAHLLVANYRPKTNDQRPKTLVTWILFVFHDTLYYPYGASSTEYRDVMASNLMMWEAIRFGKKMGLAKFDMWGALGPDPDPKDPWYGFHRFKQGYGGELVEFVGSYDLVINPLMYRVVQIADKARWFFLRLRK